MSKNNSAERFFTTLLVAGLSAGAALLFAPKSGKELRKDLKEQAESAADKGKEYAENLAHDIQESVREVEEEARRQSKKTVADPNLQHEIDNQKVAHTEDGEITAVNQPSGNVAGSIYDPEKSTVDANRPGEQSDSLMTEDGEVTEKGRAQGNITGSKFDQGRDQTIPADELDQALVDAGIDEKEL